MSHQELDTRVESCQGLVRSIAMAVHKRLGLVHELDDLIAYGQIGSAQAASEFDPTRGVQLSTYAYYRIRGAIYDGVAKMGWQRLTTRRDAAWNEILADEAQNQGGDESSESRHWLERVTERMATASLLTSSCLPTSHEIADDHAVQPVVELCREELKTYLHRLVDQLPAESAQLIRETYFEGHSLQDAADKLGVSKSWASRLHAKSLKSLGEHLRRMGFAD